MAYTLCLAPVLSLKATPKPGNLTHQTLLQRHKVGLDFPAVRFCCVKTEAAKGDQNAKTKPNSVICSDCDGNGAVLCSQCEGSGVNSVDFFGGQFKAGASCWLCGGRKEMLCGNCNGAGFLGGFMSSLDE